MTRALKGKKAGEKFQLPEGRFSRKSATWKADNEQVRVALHGLSGNWQARFPRRSRNRDEPVTAETIPWSEMGDSFESIFERARNGNGNGSGKREIS